jgi:TonB family protein
VVESSALLKRRSPKGYRGFESLPHRFVDFQPPADVPHEHRKDSTALDPFFSLAPVSDYDSDCRVLEIEPGASLEEIRQAYRDQTKVWHPDRFSNDIRLQKKAEDKLKQINLAYQRLCGREPYEPPVLNRSTERSPPGWIAVFAVRRALRKSVIAITKPFRLLMAKIINVSNKVFQWCRRQRRSLAIATTAFVLGFASGVWLLPRDSEAWAKINNLRQKIIEKARGTTQVAVAKPSPAAPTVLSHREPLAASSTETVVPAPPVARPSGEVFPWKTNVVTIVFWVGEEQVTGKTSPQHQSVWDKDWLKSFGGVDNPEPAARHDYIPISFVPRQNPFYCALPYNDVEQGQFKSEAPIVVPWFKQVHAEPGQSVCKDRWVAIRKGVRICYAQWEDCGPFRTDHFQYVFQNERATPNAGNGAGLSVSPAVRDHLGLASTDVTDWRFIEVSDVPPGPWRSYGENNHFVIAQRHLETNFDEQKRFAIPAARKPAQGATPSAESVISPSAANLEGFAEQARSAIPVAMEPAQGATPADQSVMSPSAANPDMGFDEQEGSANQAATKPAQGATPADESAMSPSAARPEKGFAERKRSANQAATKPAQARRAPDQSVISSSAAKAVTTYAPRPEYPQQARSRRIGGNGVCVVSVDPASGTVTGASMAQSTGSPLLDKSALSTLRTWKFKPGTVSKVSIPVEFTMTGDNR